MDTPTLARSTEKVRRDAVGGKRPTGHRDRTPRFRPDPRTLQVVADDPTLTSVAGLVAFGVFLQTRGVDATLAALFNDLKSGPNVVYPMALVLRLLLDLVVAGQTRVFHAEALAADPLVVRLAGGVIPCLDVLYDDLRRFTAAACAQLARQVARHGLVELRARTWTRIHLDLDSTVKVVFGHEIAGAVPGPNPKYHGRPSYHPLVARVAELDVIVGAQLRRGDTGLGAADVPWIREVLAAVRAAVGPACEIIVRLDAAGDCTAILQALDQPRTRSVVKAHVNPALRTAVAMVRPRAWRTVDRDADGRPVRQVTTVDFTRDAWADAFVTYRVVAVRTRERVGGKQLALWADPDWTAQVYVTTAWDWDEDDVAHVYNGRAGIEPLIAECKYGWAIGAIPTQDFDANHAFFLLKLLGYNLLRRFVLRHAPHLAAWRTPWLRRALVQVPGRLDATDTLHVSPQSALARLLE